MAQLTQKQVEDWIAQNGGAQSVQYSVEQKQIRNPSSDITEQTLNPYVTIQVEVWRNGKTGAELTVRREADGNFEQIENKGVDPNRTPAAGSPASAAQGATVHIEGAPDPSKPGGFDNERPVKVTRDAQGRQVGLAVPLAGKELQDWHDDRERSRNPGRKTDAEIKADQERSQQTAQQNQPQTKRESVRGKDGKAYTKVTAVNPQTGQSEVYYENTDGIKVPPPGEEKPAVALPDGAPAFDSSSPEAAYESYMKLFQFVNDLVLRGQIKPEDAQKLLAGPHSTTGMLLDRQKEQRQQDENRRRDMLTERSQDMTQANNRANWSGSAFSNAVRADQENLRGAKGRSSSLVPLMVLQAGMAQAAGGFRESPSVTSGSGLMPAVAERAGEGFKPTPPAAVGAPPNALGLGNVGSVQPSAAQIEADRQRVMGQNAAATAPLLLPQPAGQPAASPNTGQTGDPMTQPPAINPATGEPTGLTPLPVNGQFPADIPIFSPRTGGPPLHPPGMGGPAGGNVQMAPNWGPMGGPTAAYTAGMRYGQPNTADDLEQQLIAEGYSPDEVRAARQRAQSRASVMVA